MLDLWVDGLSVLPIGSARPPGHWPRKFSATAWKPSLREMTLKAPFAKPNLGRQRKRAKNT
jgi:hypothetical protein